MPSSWIQDLRRLDAERPSLPGEHWLTLAAGVALLALAARNLRRGGGSTTLLAGLGLVVRAASGRDGPLQRLRERMPYRANPGARRVPTDGSAGDPPYL